MKDSEKMTDSKDKKRIKKVLIVPISSKFIPARVSLKRIYGDISEYRDIVLIIGTEYETIVALAAHLYAEYGHNVKSMQELWQVKSQGYSVNGKTVSSTSLRDAFNKAVERGFIEFFDTNGQPVEKEETKNGGYLYHYTKKGRKPNKSISFSNETENVNKYRINPAKTRDN